MTTAAPSERHKRTTYFILGATGIGGIVLLGLVVFAFRLFLGGGAMILDGPSMAPTYVDGDRFFATPEDSYGRGDVVMVLSPADDVRVVKRIVAVAGDRIRIEDDRLFLNGVEVERRVLGAASGEESDIECIAETIDGRTWVTSRSVLSAPETMAELTVPPGTVFLLGDHRDRSNDSRNPRFGFVPVDRIFGRLGDVYSAGTPEFVCPPAGLAPASP